MDSTIRVVAAENNRDMCAVLEALIRAEPDLEWAGSAEDGLQALDMIVQVKPDVVLLDIIMPYLDGLGVLQRLAEMDLEKRPGIIVVTAFEEEGIVKRSVRLGADYYLLKPFDRACLLSRIRQVAGVDRALPLRARSVPCAAAHSKTCDQVARVLFKMGTPTYFKGYQYLKEAIEMVTSDPSLLAVITKSLYPRIAEKHGTTPLIVEAAIRYAIQKTWKHGNGEYLKAVFGQCGATRDGKAPTNSFFIARIAEELRLGIIESA
ncbi:MAG: sporulation transcription factor Spo0A [Firmicutes bacterium]|jgi:two-component system response regulator (stage 0 sporulation protein A)|nr:sporulation transcription factor Spo0A [Bacillota bacterium]MDH7496699.1 sporulation transcription factor Spo0A [Bacillota bacterium]